jgi:hypothetical protein
MIKLKRVHSIGMPRGLDKKPKFKRTGPNLDARTDIVQVQVFVIIIIMLSILNGPALSRPFCSILNFRSHCRQT